MTSIFNNNSEKNIILIILCFILLTLFAYTVRTYDYNRESVSLGGEFVPFTLESAMMYSYSRDIAENGSLPDNDRALVGMDDVQTNKQMSISMEYFLGYGYRIKEFIKRVLYTNVTHITDKYNVSSITVNRNIYGDNPSFSIWARFQIRLWISVSAGLIFIWLVLSKCSMVMSFFGGLLFAVSPAAIARATGQDLIRENFAIPLILLTLIVYLWYINKTIKYNEQFTVESNNKKCKLGFTNRTFSIGLGRVFILILLALCCFTALASWDMVQLCFSLWGCYEIINILICKEKPLTRRVPWIVIFIVSIAAAIFIPYLNSHNLIVSPMISIIFPTVLVLTFCGKKRLGRIILAVIVIVCMFLLWYFILKHFGYSDNYSHFANLIKAKINFGNVKPLNPELLNFDARMLWTPALHSATKKILWMLFHLTFPLFAILLFLTLLFPKSRKCIANRFNDLGLPLFFTLFYFLMFILMVRFHALCIPFLCITLALIFDIIYRISNPVFKVILVIVFGLLIVSESEWFLKLSRQYNGNMSMNTELIKWVNSNPNMQKKVVLANFTLSPMLKAYCSSRIVLQPKFELGKTRDMVEEYMNILYFGNEQQFLKFCEKYQVDYFIYDKGLAAGGKNGTQLHPWSSRYIAAAKVLKPKSPVYECFYNPDRMSNFYRIDEKSTYSSVDKRYLIFKVISKEDKKKAASLYKLAVKALKKNKRNQAKELIKSAVELNPMSVRIRYSYYQLFNKKWPFITLNGLKEIESKSVIGNK